MKKWKTIMLISLCVQIMPLLGLNITESGTDIKDTLEYM